MKVWKVWTIFFILFGLLGGYIFWQKDRIDTNFFSLIENDEIKENSYIFHDLKKQISKEIVFLIDDKNISDTLILKLKNSNLFKKVTYSFDGDYKRFIKDLNSSKLALLDKKNFKILKENPTLFFKNSIREIFSPFGQRVLGVGEDFFGLTKDYGKINQTKVYFDIKDERLKVKDRDKIYFFINASLKDKYNDEKLLRIILDSQDISKKYNSSFLVSGGAIYSALGKQTGEQQGFYMSLAALLLTALLLWLAFKNIKIFFILFVAVFGLIFGLSGTFLFFKKVHILGIVLSTSLIGLMYDFALHWLSFSSKKLVPVKRVLKIFLLGFFITTTGYGVFLFAPFELLKQVAVFSIFALIGAFLTTYFLLPTLFYHVNFKASRKFVSILDLYQKFLLKTNRVFHIKSLILILLLGIGFYTFLSLKFVDNIKDYASTPKSWLNLANKISKITNVQNSTEVVIVNGVDFLKKEIDFTNELKDKKLISSYNGISNFFLSKKEQEEVKRLFKTYKNDKQILSLFREVGIKKDIVLQQFDSVNALKSQPISQIVTKPTFIQFSHFLPQKDKSIIYLNSTKDKDEIFRIAKKHHVLYVDFISSLNTSFENIKIISIKLKIYAYIVAAILLAIFFGAKRAFLMISLVLISTLLALFVMSLFGFHINIFAIYGLILASAVGIDYMIFAQNNDQSTHQKLFGITLASLTTFISFFILSFSSTPAVSVFGVSVSICVICCAFFASLLTINQSIKKV